MGVFFLDAGESIRESEVEKRKKNGKREKKKKEKKKRKS